MAARMHRVTSTDRDNLGRAPSARISFTVPPRTSTNLTGKYLSMWDFVLTKGDL